MPNAQDPIDLEVRRQALRFSLQGARSSIPMLWAAVAVVLVPGLDHPGAWPVWLIGSLAVASGLWRLWFARRFSALQAPDEPAVRRAEWQIQANAALSGLIWLLSTMLLFPGLNPEQATLHLSVLLGTTAVASYYMGLIGRSFELIAVPVTAPLILLAVWLRSPHVVEVSVACLAFFGAMLRGARHFRRTTLLALRQGLEMAAANRELEATRQRLELESAAKARFLNTMGHELRRPLAGTLGALDLMAEEPLTGAQRQLLDSARESGHALREALAGLMEHSQLDTAPVVLKIAPLSPRALAEEVLQEQAAAAAAKGLALSLETDSALPGWVMGDRERLLQVLGGLLSNAVRFSDRGQITLRVRSGAPSIRFEVEDQGRGIAPDDHERVFQPYYQVDSGPQRAATGAGLGLAIARRLVRSMGSEIRLDSGPNRGSRFSFDLSLSPAVAPPAAPVTVRPAPSPIPGAVLVVDDDPHNRLVCVEMLARHGLSVVEATDGLEALAQLQRGGVALVLMDGQMPHLDGYEATRQWREREDRLGSPRVPIIGVSANHQPDHARLAEQSGMDGHLAKPFGMADLIRQVRHWLPAAAA